LSPQECEAVAKTFFVPLSYGAQNQMRPRVKSIQFNDGYELRLGDGLNTMPQRWSVGWNALDQGGANAVEAWFVEHAGVRWFWWVPPRQTAPIKVVCKEWTRGPVDGSRTHDAMTAVFQQVFDLTG
jgi:phage-related protein